MDAVLDQVLEKLLSERDKTSRLERAISKLRHITHRISEVVDGPQDDGLIEVVAAMQSEAARAKVQVARYDSLEIGEVRDAVEHALVAVGLTPSGNLRIDAENLSRFVSATRPAFGGIL
jgi:hypothetical protein